MASACRLECAGQAGGGGERNRIFAHGSVHSDRSHLGRHGATAASPPARAHTSAGGDDWVAGAGKTLVAVHFAQHILGAQTLAEKRPVVFLVDRIPLVFQQAEVFIDQSEPAMSVGRYCGDMDMQAGARTCIRLPNVQGAKSSLKYHIARSRRHRPWIGESKCPTMMCLSSPQGMSLRTHCQQHPLSLTDTRPMPQHADAVCSRTYSRRVSSLS